MHWKAVKAANFPPALSQNATWDNIVMAQGQQHLMEIYRIFPLVLRNDMWQEEFDTEQLLKIYCFPYLFREVSSNFLKYGYCLEFQLFKWR